MEQLIHILHLEDDPADAELAQAKLESAGLTCQITRVQARDEFDAALRRGGYDVILADYRLPLYDGMSALRLAQELCPDVPFIFVSGTMGEDAAIEGLTEGATDYVLKQKLSRLAPAITRALHEAKNQRECRRAEEALRALSERYEAILAAAPDIIMEVDNNKVYTWANQAGLEFFGADIVGREAAFYFEGEQDIYGLVQPLFKGDENVIYVESWQRRQDGEKRLLAWWCRVLKDAQGNVTGALSTGRDITDHKQAEAALRESEERLRQITDNMVDMIAQFDTQAVYQYVSPSYEKILGYRPTELIGTWALEMLHPDEKEQAIQAIAAMLRLGAGSTQFRFRHKDGSYHWIESTGRNLLEATGQTIGSIMGSRDITARKQAEAALRESEDRYRQLFEAESDAIFLIDNETGRLLEANNATSVLYGYSREELLAKKNTDLSAEPEETQQVTQGTPVIADQVINIPLRFHRHKDGTVFPVEITGRFFTWQGRLVHIAAIRDITKRKQAEEHLKKTLAEKEALLRELYHRTKNNMQVICAMLELQAEGVTDTYVLNAFKDMDNRIRAMALVHQMLYQSQNLSSIDLEQYIEDLTMLLRRSYEVYSPHISFALDLKSVMVLIDTAIPCGLIVNELVSNALKHAFPADRPGEISIKLRQTADGTIMLTVADNGIGLPPGFDPRQAATMGLQILFILGERQLQGQVTLVGEGGVSCQICFQDTLYEARV